MVCLPDVFAISSHSLVFSRPESLIQSRPLPELSKCRTSGTVSNSDESLTVAATRLRLLVGDCFRSLLIMSTEIETLLSKAETAVLKYLIAFLSCFTQLEVAGPRRLLQFCSPGGRFYICRRFFRLRHDEIIRRL